MDKVIYLKDLGYKKTKMTHHKKYILAYTRIEGNHTLSYVRFRNDKTYVIYQYSGITLETHEAITNEINRLYRRWENDNRRIY